MKNNPRFELVIQLRDHKGNLTGKTRSFATDYPEELEEFWLKNNTAKNKQRYEQIQSKRNKNRRPSGSPSEGTGKAQEG